MKKKSKSINVSIPFVNQQWTLQHLLIQTHHHLSLRKAFPLQNLLFAEKWMTKDKAYLPPARRAQIDNAAMRSTK